MTDIDLTPAVNAAARRLWIDQAQHHYSGQVTGTAAEIREATRAMAAEDWDNGHVSHGVMNNMRETVLPLVWEAHRHIAAATLRHEAGTNGWEWIEGYGYDYTAYGKRLRARAEELDPRV